MKASDVCTAALRELGVYAPTDTPAAEDLQFALDKFNRLLDNWNAERAAVYTVQFLTFNLITNHQPTTIGPTGDINLTQRPVSIEAANLIYTGVTPNVRIPLDVLDAEGWKNVAVPTLTATLPIALYYSPDWPLGNLYLTPIPTVTNILELEARIVLSQVALTTAISFPPGYLDAITLTLAESLLAQYPRKTNADLLVAQAAKARARIFANNDVTPSIRTQDFGMPSASRHGELFNYLTRTFS